MQAAKNDAFSNPTHFAGPEQPQIQVSQREQDPSAAAVRHDAPGAEWEQQFHVFDEERQERGGGSGAPAFGDYLERRPRTRRQILQPVQRDAPVIARVLVKGMAERRDQVNVAAGRGDADDFAEHRAGIGDVFSTASHSTRVKMPAGNGRCSASAATSTPGMASRSRLT